MIIQLDKPREWKLTTRGVIKYSKLGYGKIADITNTNNDIIKNIASKLGKEDFAKLLKIYNRQSKAKTKEEIQKLQMEVGLFVQKHGIDFSDVQVDVSTEQAISIIKIGLECGAGKEYTDDEVYEMIDKASDNPKSDVTPYNIEQYAYNLVVDSQADELDRELEKAVPLRESQAKKNS